MRDGISPSEYEDFRRFLEQACGIVLGESKQYLVSSRLGRLQQELEVANLADLLERIKHDRSGALRARVVDAMTTNETYWFRDQHPFAILSETLIPALVEQKTRKIRIWSAACSSGQEPYSIAMSLLEHFSAKMRAVPDIEIVATDISPSVLKQAASGCYDELAAARGLSPERRQRFFVADGKNWRLKDEVRRLVKFQEVNLMKNFTGFGKFHVIFCRNVLIYFATDLKMDILKRLGESLEPGGHLFLGGSESMATYSNAFETVRFKSGLAYRVKPKA
jgi:chemotaxis protein methyltransferase CheR